tara:strand:+ start:128 stop:817 length:690 start_codon:yes stop_codon:yes gene_type:complete
MLKKYENICKKENIKLTNLGLSDHSFGNVSIRVNLNSFFIKPSGIDVKRSKTINYPLIDIKTGKVINKSKFKPSVDTPTHLKIYSKYSQIKSIAHCHSKYATAWAQSSKPIPLLGTTHADYWNSSIPVTRQLTKKELQNYEFNIGKIICEKIKKGKIDVKSCPGLLVSGHAQFSWSLSVLGSVKNSSLIEQVAQMAFMSIKIGIKKKIPKFISDFHFNRKHGKKKYYGQ